jgi:hypothetical protein
VFQRSGTYQVSFANKGISAPADLRGKKVGNWGFGNEFELFAGLSEAGLKPAGDVTLVQQQFDMQALLNGDIDAAQAMSYNEYAQVLEAKNPATGQALPAVRLHRSSTGTTSAPRCCRTPSGRTPTSCPTRPTRTDHVKFIAGLARGLGVLPRQPRVVPRHRRQGRARSWAPATSCGR